MVTSKTVRQFCTLYVAFDGFGLTVENGALIVIEETVDLISVVMVDSVEAAVVIVSSSKGS
jgi:hypothetical protein